MFNTTGPIQPNVPNIQERVDQFLKVNQRIAGEILSISNEQVVLAVNGVQIVAKMTSAEQLATLMDKRYAYFVVKDINESQITLQLASPTQSANPQKSITNNPIGQVLLEQFGLPVEEGNVIIVQAALNRGLKITPELMGEIRQVLDLNPGWGSAEAQLAAAIKSAGLPLTEGSLELARNSVKEIRSNFVALFEQLVEFNNRPGISPQIQNSIRNAINTLQAALIQGGDSTENMEKNLATAFKGLGVSLEKDISKLLDTTTRENQSKSINNVMFTLANLRHELGNTTNGRLSSVIDNFIQAMRWMHFVNVEPDQPLAKGQWTQLDLPISFGFNTINRTRSDDVHNLQIRVARENEGEQKINPDYTRLVIMVDLDEDNIIKVDLSIVSHMVGAEVTASSEEICLKASEELDEFKIGLTNLGYTLKTSKIELGKSTLEMDLNESRKSLTPISSVDLGI